MLEANGFAPAVVAGTSAGSVVGALYASGMNAFEMQEKAVALDEAKIRDLQLSSGGLVLGQKLEDYVNEQVRRKPLEQMAKPFVVVATRLEDGERTVFARGNTGQAVRASSSVPGVFQPVTIGKYHFVDGGIVSPVPVDAARQLGADIVIAVDISNKARGQTPGDMLGTLGQSIAIMGQKLGQAELARADVIIRPQVLDIGSADFSQRANAILEGEKAALAVMPQIRERVAQLQAERALPPGVRGSCPKSGNRGIARNAGGLQNHRRRSGSGSGASPRVPERAGSVGGILHVPASLPTAIWPPRPGSAPCPDAARTLHARWRLGGVVGGFHGHDAFQNIQAGRLLVVRLPAVPALRPGGQWRCQPPPAAGRPRAGRRGPVRPASAGWPARHPAGPSIAVAVPTQCGPGQRRAQPQWLVQAGLRACTITLHAQRQGLLAQVVGLPGAEVALVCIMHFLGNAGCVRPVA
jgi:NTE family protein